MFRKKRAESPPVQEVSGEDQFFDSCGTTYDDIVNNGKKQNVEALTKSGIFMLKFLHQEINDIKEKVKDYDTIKETLDELSAQHEKSNHHMQEIAEKLLEIEKSLENVLEEDAKSVKGCYEKLDLIHAELRNVVSCCCPNGGNNAPQVIQQPPAQPQQPQIQTSPAPQQQAPPQPQQQAPPQQQYQAPPPPQTQVQEPQVQEQPPAPPQQQYQYQTPANPAQEYQVQEPPQTQYQYQPPPPAPPESFSEQNVENVAPGLTETVEVQPEDNKKPASEFADNE